MKRMNAFAVALATLLMATAAHAASVSDVEAPRASLQAARHTTQDVEAPRGQNAQAHSTDDVEAPRSVDAR